MAAVRLGHIKWLLAALLVLGTVPLSTGSARAEPGCTVSPLLVNSCRPWLGANAGGYPGVPTPIDAQIAAHESRIGRSVDVAHTYHQPGQNSLNATDLALINRPGTLLYTSWKPAPVWADADGSDPAVNSTIDQMAASIRAVSPKKIFLTVYHEPQNDVSGGAAGCPTDMEYVGTSGTPADYRAMWRNVRERFDALGVDNVVWAVNFMSYSVLDCMTQEMWPGNDLVDWVMWDFYGTPTVTFDAGVSAFYNKLLAWNDADHDYASKPWGLAEWNIKSSYTQAQATQFYDDARAAVAGNTYPRLKLFMVFDNANGKNTRVGYDSSGLVDAGQAGSLHGVRERSGVLRRLVLVRRRGADRGDHVTCHGRDGVRGDRRDRDRGRRPGPGDHPSAARRRAERSGGHGLGRHGDGVVRHHCR